MRREHVPALDGVRGIAILLVLANHFATLLGLEGTGPVSHALVKLAAAGWTGVNLFFVLSGFLITGILLDAKGGDGYFRAFFARRALRIWPVYFGWLAIIFVAFPLVGIGQGANYQAALRHQGWYWAHLTNVMMAIREIAPRPDYPTTHFWSLAVEEQFYLAWPFVVLACTPRTLLRVCLWGAVLAVVGRIVASVAGIPHDAIYVITPLRMDALLLGGAAAVLMRDPALRPGMPTLARGAAVAGALGVGLVLLVSGRFEYRDLSTATLGDASVALLSAGLVIGGAVARAGSAANAILSVGILRSIGKYSYTMYVVHTAVVRQFGVYLPFESLRPLGTIGVSQALYFLAYVAEVYLVALVSWHLVEKHMLRLKRFVPYGRGRPALDGLPGPA